MEAINPYSNRGRILESAKFYGRQRELREVFNRLATMQSVSIIGQRRIGKSSFLNRIANPKPDELTASFTIRYLDLQRVFSATEFYERACRELKREQGESHLDLEEAIEGKKVIFCLDEFEQAYEQDFGSEFFNALRSLAQTGNLALVTATQTPLNELHDIFLQSQDVTSKFHNIFDRLELGEFTPAEAKEMVETPRNGRRFNDDEVGLILKLGKTHPHWLNIACALVYEAKRNKSFDPKEVERQFNEELGVLHTSTVTENQTDRPKPAQSEQATADPVAASKAERAIRISVALSLVAGIMMFFATRDPNPISLILSGGVLLVSLGFLIATRMLWPKETRRGEQ